MYKIQINMAEDNQPGQWEDVEVTPFEEYNQAEAHIGWMLKEYGDTIEYRIVEMVAE